MFSYRELIWYRCDSTFCKGEATPKTGSSLAVHLHHSFCFAFRSHYRQRSGLAGRPSSDVVPAPSMSSSWAREAVEQVRPTQPTVLHPPCQGPKQAWLQTWCGLKSFTKSTDKLLATSESVRQALLGCSNGYSDAHSWQKSKLHTTILSTKCSGLLVLTSAKIMTQPINPQIQQQRLEPDRLQHISQTIRWHQKPIWVSDDT